MIVYIQPNDRSQYRDYVKQYFKLRKRVFCDHHGWVDANPDGTETDHLDEIYNLYILYVDQDSEEVLGGVRLNPSTGETLLHTAWADMLPDPNDFRSPNIWEATRFCVDEQKNTGRGQKFVNKIFLALMLAILDFANTNGITSIMAVCESRLVRMFKAFSGGPEIVATKTEADGCEIDFVVWPTDEALRASFEWARPYIGGTQPIQIAAA